MNGLPMLIAVTKPMAGPKVPILRRMRGVVVAGLCGTDRVVVYGMRDFHRQLVATIESNGLHPLYPDDYHGCEELWAEKEGLSSIRVYAWLE